MGVLSTLVLSTVAVCVVFKTYKAMCTAIDDIAPPPGRRAKPAPISEAATAEEEATPAHVSDAATTHDENEPVAEPEPLTATESAEEPSTAHESIAEPSTVYEPTEEPIDEPSTAPEPIAELIEAPVPATQPTTQPATGPAPSTEVVTERAAVTVHVDEEADHDVDDAIVPTIASDVAHEQPQSQFQEQEQEQSQFQEQFQEQEQEQEQEPATAVVHHNQDAPTTSTTAEEDATSLTCSPTASSMEMPALQTPVVSASKDPRAPPPPPPLPPATPPIDCSLTRFYCAKLCATHNQTLCERLSAFELLRRLVAANNGRPFQVAGKPYDVVGVVASLVRRHTLEDASDMLFRNWFPRYQWLAGQRQLSLTTTTTTTSPTSSIPTSIPIAIQVMNPVAAPSPAPTPTPVDPSDALKWRYFNKLCATYSTTHSERLNAFVIFGFLIAANNGRPFDLLCRPDDVIHIVAHAIRSANACTRVLDHWYSQYKWLVDFGVSSQGDIYGTARDIQEELSNYRCPETPDTNPNTSTDSNSSTNTNSNTSTSMAA